MKKLILATVLILAVCDAQADSSGGGSEFKLPVNPSVLPTLTVGSGNDGPAREIYNEMLATEENRSPADGSYTDYVKTVGNIRCERFQMGAPGPDWSYTCIMKLKLR